MKNKLPALTIMLIIMIFTMIVMPSFVYADTITLTFDNNYTYGNIKDCKGNIVTSNGKKICKNPSGSIPKVTCEDTNHEISKINKDGDTYVLCRKPNDDSVISYNEKNIYNGEKNYTFHSTNGPIMQMNSKYCILKSGSSVKVDTNCYITGINGGESIVMEYDYLTYSTKYYKYKVNKGIQTISELDKNYEYSDVTECLGLNSNTSMITFDNTNFCGAVVPVLSKPLAKCSNLFQSFDVIFSVNNKTYIGQGCRRLKTSSNSPNNNSTINENESNNSQTVSSSSGITTNGNSSTSGGNTTNQYCYCVRGNNNDCVISDKPYDVYKSKVDMSYCQPETDKKTSCYCVSGNTNDCIVNDKPAGEYRSEVDMSYCQYANDNSKYANLCADKGILDAVRIIGYLVTVAKWIVPLIIIVMGMIDFGKAVISSDEKALNQATSALIRRLIAGVIVFIIPGLILAVLDVIKIGGIENTKRFDACTRCILDAPKYCPVNKK